MNLYIKYQVSQDSWYKHHGIQDSMYFSHQGKLKSCSPQGIEVDLQYDAWPKETLTIRINQSFAGRCWIIPNFCIYIFTFIYLVWMTTFLIWMKDVYSLKHSQDVFLFSLSLSFSSSGYTYKDILYSPWHLTFIFWRHQWEQKSFIRIPDGLQWRHLHGSQKGIFFISILPNS